ncbi:MAG: diaminopimelate epimerase, partial [Bacteroidia bacterium]|nr:diaminopimelate epimerase [Bacteroidia bacterium]
MTVEFIKYHGTGNDFILIDNRKLQIDKKDKDRIDSLCDRHFGIGADGLILLENSELADFKMIYFNSDGNESSMCGNGGRCIAHFARSLGLVTDKAAFEAVDGIHNVRFEDEQIALSMSDVKDMVRRSDAIILDTG